MKDSSIYNVRVLERMMDVLACLNAGQPDRGISEIARELGLSPATVFRILATLQNSGYVERTTGGERYRLGFRFAELGIGVLRRIPVRRLAKPFMVSLAERYGETCDLSVLSGHEALCIGVAQGHHVLRIAATDGYRSPLHCTATGKVFLAAMPPDEAAAILRAPLMRYTDRTITSPERLLEQIEQTRARGYGLDDEELGAGVRAVAAPIRDGGGQVAAVIGIVGPVERMGEERVREFGAALVEAARDVSARLGP